MTRALVRPHPASDNLHVFSTNRRMPARTLPAEAVDWRPLGEILVERGLVSQLRLEEALQTQRREGGRLGEILFARGWVSAIDLRDALAEQHGLDLQVERVAGHSEVGSMDAQRAAIPLGRLLVQRGQITEAQLDKALAEQAKTGRRLGAILVDSGALSTAVLASALAEQQGLRITVSGLDKNVESASLPRSTCYEVRQGPDGTIHRLCASDSFLDATDLAFAVLYECEPKELQVVRVARDGAQELCWQYPPAA